MLSWNIRIYCTNTCSVVLVLAANMFSSHKCCLFVYLEINNCRNYKVWHLEAYSLWVMKHILNITSTAIIQKFTAWLTHCHLWNKNIFPYICWCWCYLNIMIWSYCCCETNKNCWPERLSVAYYTCILQTNLMLKNLRYPQKSMFTATGGPTDVPLLVPG